MRNLLLALSLFAFVSACKDDTLTPEEQLSQDIEKIRADLTNRGLTAQSTASGLHYIITEAGTGGHPSLQSTVTVAYRGTLLDGQVFDETDPGQTVTFALQNLIAGWQEGIPLLKRGGKGTFWIPSALGYGPQGSGPVPGNAVLVFEIELVAFQ